MDATGNQHYDKMGPKQHLTKTNMNKSKVETGALELGITHYGVCQCQTRIGSPDSREQEDLVCSI